MRVLIAEDDSMVLLGLTMLVEKLNHEVVMTAHDGKSAYEGALKCKPDLILMDINMPTLNGIEALRLLAMHGDFACVFITAYSDNSFIEEASSLGAVGYVVKPVDERQLHASIELGMKRYNDTLLARKEANHYRNALEERKTIERAKGILMERLGIKEVEAMKRLQKRSRDTNTTILIIAEDIIHADKCFR